MPDNDTPRPDEEQDEPSGEDRDTIITARMTVEDRRTIRRAAAELDIPMSHFMSKAALEEARRVLQAAGLEA